MNQDKVDIVLTEISKTATAFLKLIFGILMLAFLGFLACGSFGAFFTIYFILCVLAVFNHLIEKHEKSKLG